MHVAGGRGGSGCSSYDTDPYGKGGPDGANGGRGGDVYLVSTDSLSSFALESFHLRAHNGHAGGSQLSKGRNGYSLKVPIPSGSIVSEILDSDPVRGEFRLRFLADLDRSGLEIKVASGGAGGLGQPRVSHAVSQAESLLDCGQLWHSQVALSGAQMHC